MSDSSARSFPFGQNDDGQAEGSTRSDEGANGQDKPMYRSMPAAFFGPDETNEADSIKPDDTPKYRSLGAMQPAFEGEFSQAPKYSSSFTGGSGFGSASSEMPPNQPHGFMSADQNYPEVAPQEPIWRSMGAFSDMPSVGQGGGSIFEGAGGAKATFFPEQTTFGSDKMSGVTGETGAGAPESDGALPPVWDSKARNAAAYSSGGAHANFVTAFGAHKAGNEMEAQAKLVMDAVQEALVKSVPGGVTQHLPSAEQGGARWKISANVFMPQNDKAPPAIFFLRDSQFNQRQGQGGQDEGTLCVELRLFRFASGQGSNSLSRSSGGLYGEPGVGPPVRVVIGGFASSGKVEIEFVLTILLVSGIERVFKTFVDAYKSVLRGQRSALAVEEHNSNASLASAGDGAGAVTAQPAGKFRGLDIASMQAGAANECDEDGGGYLALGHELYPGSLVMTPRRATNLALMAAPAPVPAPAPASAQAQPSSDGFGASAGVEASGFGCGINPQVQIDATSEIAIACGQRTFPIGANCGLLASSALDEELRQQQMNPPERKDDSADMKEGLKLVYRLLTNGKPPSEETSANGNEQMDDADAEAAQVDVVFDQVQWYALWILLRLAIEAQRRRDMPEPPQQPQQPQQKPNSKHESPEDFIAYFSRVMQLLKLCKAELIQIIASVPMHEDDQWCKPQLAQVVLDLISELSGGASREQLPSQGQVPSPEQVPSSGASTEPLLGERSGTKRKGCCEQVSRTLKKLGMAMSCRSGNDS